jgi:hypothetical protein
MAFLLEQARELITEISMAPAGWDESRDTWLRDTAALIGNN